MRFWLDPPDVIDSRTVVNDSCNPLQGDWMVFCFSRGSRITLVAPRALVAGFRPLEDILSSRLMRRLAAQLFRGPSRRRASLNERRNTARALRRWMAADVDVVVIGAGHKDRKSVV